MSTQSKSSSFFKILSELTFSETIISYDLFNINYETQLKGLIKKTADLSFAFRYSFISVLLEPVRILILDLFMGGNIIWMAFAILFVSFNKIAIL